MKKLINVAIIMAGTLILSCSQNYLNENDVGDINNLGLKSSLGFDKRKDDYNKNIRKFAKSIAKSLKDKDFRKLVKNEALLKVDGQHDMIWKNFKTKQATLKGKNKIVDEHIFENFSKAEYQEFHKFSDTYKKLQLSVPIHCEKWDTDSFEPLVAVQLADYSEDDKYIEAYDSSGKLVLLDNKIAPNFPVIVVNLNERSDENGDILELYKRKTLLKSSITNDFEIPDYPSPPSNFESQFTVNGVYLTWLYITNPLYTDVVELEKLVSGNYTMVPGFPKSDLITSHLDTDASNPGVGYYYRIRIKRRIIDGGGNISYVYSPYTTTYVLGTNLEPNKPGELYVANLAPNNIELRWGQPANSVYTGFKIYRRRPGIDNYSLRATLSSDTYYYIDQNFDGQGQKYHYYLVAYNDAGNSEPVWEVTYNPYRNENEKLVITGFEISNYSTYESWSNAGPEVTFSLAAADSPSSTTTTLLVSKERIPVVEDGPTPDPNTTTIRKWKVSNSLGYYEALRNWDSNFFKSVLTINCYEHDGSWLGKIDFDFSTKLPIKIDSTATIETTFGGNIEINENSAKEKQFGTDWLYFWDPEIMDLVVGPDLTLHFETR